MEVNFCRRCGSAMQPMGNGGYKCAHGHHIFIKASPAVGIMLLNSKDELLLSERGIEPNKGTLDLPGGFCNPDESLLQALERELKEELGLAPSDYGQPKYVADASNLYPFEGEDGRSLHVIFWARLHDDTTQLHATDDVAGVVWTPLAKVDLALISPDDDSIRLAIPILKKELGL